MPARRSSRSCAIYLLKLVKEDCLSVNVFVVRKFQKVSAFYTWTSVSFLQSFICQFLLLRTNLTHFGKLFVMCRGHV